MRKELLLLGVALTMAGSAMAESEEATSPKLYLTQSEIDSKGTSSDFAQYLNEHPADKPGNDYFEVYQIDGESKVALSFDDDPAVQVTRDY